MYSVKRETKKLERCHNSLQMYRFKSNRYLVQYEAQQFQYNGRQWFVVFPPHSLVWPLSWSRELLHQEGTVYRRMFEVHGILSSSPSSRSSGSPRSPNGVGWFRRFPEGTRDADRALGWRVHILRHVDRDVGGCTDSWSFARCVDSRGCTVSKSIRGWTFQSSKAATEMSHELRAGSGMNSGGYRSRQEGRDFLSALCKSFPESVSVAVLRRQSESSGSSEGVKMTNG